MTGYRIHYFGEVIESTELCASEEMIAVHIDSYDTNEAA